MLSACSGHTPAHLPQGPQLGFLPAFLASELVLAFLASELELAFLALGQVQVRDLLGAGQKLPLELREGRPLFLPAPSQEPHSGDHSKSPLGSPE